jgi:RIO kinase 1
LHTETLDEALEPFFVDGLIEDILYLIKSGKEASVFCCRSGPKLGGEGLVAAKVYKPSAYRSFRDDSLYREGRVILDRRSARAAAKRTQFGEKVRSSMWTNHEWDTLAMLHAAGSDVPRPLAHSSGALLLEFVGDADGAAPMLRDVDFASDEAEAVFERILDNIQLWLAYNVVHGDLSPYNVLYRGEGDPVVIDFPQACDPRFNTNAFRRAARRVQPGGELLVGLGAAVGSRKLSQRSGVPGIELVCAKAPGPVRFGRAGRIHARVAVEIQQILQRQDGGIGSRRQRDADQIGGDVRARGAKVAPHGLLFGGWRVREPAA